MSDNPQPPPGGGAPPPSPMGGGMPAGGSKPDNYLVWAILSTLFCCLPFGIVSIVFAAQVDGKWNSGDAAGAVEASQQAKKWAKVAAFVGGAVIMLWIILQAALINASSPGT